jgi:hypothetical protein
MPFMDEQVEQALRKVVNRAVNDPKFRVKCLQSPLEAIAEAGGVQLPAESKFRFVEKQEGETIIVLPPALGSGGEITDEKALDGISGGNKNLFWYA